MTGIRRLAFVPAPAARVERVNRPGRTNANADHARCNLPAIGARTMVITSVHCHVLGANVTCVGDLEGSVTQVICAEYDPLTSLCRVKRSALAGGPLSRLLERVADDTLAGHGSRCDLR
jgi:hypothetical protein